MRVSQESLCTPSQKARKGVRKEGIFFTTPKVKLMIDKCTLPAFVFVSICVYSTARPMHRCTVQKKGTGVFVCHSKRPCFVSKTAFSIDSRIPSSNHINLFTEIPRKLSTSLFKKREENPEYFNISFFCLSIIKKYQKRANGANLKQNFPRKTLVNALR